MDFQLLAAVHIGICVLLFLILRLKFQAFIALLITCIVVGVIAGMEPVTILESVKNGMGGTLGFVATVVDITENTDDDRRSKTRPIDTQTLWGEKCALGSDAYRVFGSDSCVF